MSTFIKDRLYISLCFGIVVGGLLAAISCTLWLTFGHDSSDSIPKTLTQLADSTRPQLILTESTDFDDLNESVSNFELTAALHSFLVRKGEDDLLILLDQTASAESETVRGTVQSVVFERLVDIDPNAALQYALDRRGNLQKESLDTIFREWAFSDLDTAVAAAINLDHHLSRAALRTVVLARSDLSANLRQDIELHLDDDDFIQTVIAEERTWLHSQTPEEAWYAAIGDGKQLSKRVGLLASIAEVWWRQDSEVVLQKIVESTVPSSHQWNSDTYVVLRLLVQALAEHAPQEVFDQAANLAEPFREALVRAVSEHWSRFDPHAAFLAVSQFESDARRKTVTRVVVQAWARSNPDELVQKSDSFALALQTIAMEEAILSLGRTNRDEATKVLQDAHRKGIVAMNSLDSFFTQWVMSDRRGAIQWILSNEDLQDHEREGILKVILRTVAMMDSRRSLQLRIRLASLFDTSVEQYEADLVRTLANSDLESAISLLPSVRRESKFKSASVVGEVLVFGDQPMRALGLADQLPRDQRSDYYYGVFVHWSRHDPKHLVESITSLSPRNLRMLAAKALTQSHARVPALSPEELEYVKRYLDEG